MGNERQRWARHPLAVDSNQVFSALEKMATVSLIATRATELQTCEIDASAVEICRDPRLSDFDFLPVRHDGTIVGLFDRRSPNGTAAASLRVSDRMQPLSGNNLISADAGILSFISQADHCPCRLLVKDTEIWGIVTTADLNALPVRPVLFLLFTHVELLMAERIRTTFDVPEYWIKLLSDGRQDKLHKKHSTRLRKNMYTDLLSATDYCDKRTIIMKGHLVPANVSTSPESDLKRIEELRDKVAHASGYADSPEQAADLAGVVRLCRTWIEGLISDLTSSERAK